MREFLSKRVCSRGNRSKESREQTQTNIIQEDSSSNRNTVIISSTKNTGFKSSVTVCVSKSNKYKQTLLCFKVVETKTDAKRRKKDSHLQRR